MANTLQKLHAILVPFPFQGHVNPAVHLAIKLATQGFTITFVNTHYIHQQTSQAQHNAGDDIFAGARESGLDIRYTTVSDGLPLGFDRSRNHTQYHAALAHVFSVYMEELVAEIIGSGESVTCLIADTFFGWPSKLAKKFGLLCISFWTEAALVFTLYYHIDLLRINGHLLCQDRREDPIDYIPGVKEIGPKDLTSYLQETDLVAHEKFFRMFEDAKHADFVLCNTVQEFEEETISALQAKIPFFAIGPIIPFGSNNGTVATSLWSESDCTQWLDTKPNGSVLYVSFGSYVHVTKRDLVVIAHGLALSKVNFVWVIRPRIVKSEDADPLPVGFKEDIGDRGMIIPWCHQMTVLAHPAIGGFLTHCGWNSVLESIWSQVPLLCFPLLTDQFTNRKMVVDDWKVGINLSNGDSITKEEVAENINRLMSGKSADAVRKAIKEVKNTLGSALKSDGSSNKNMDQFIEDLKVKVYKYGSAP